MTSSQFSSVKNGERSPLKLLFLANEGNIVYGIAIFSIVKNDDCNFYPKDSNLLHKNRKLQSFQLKKEEYLQSFIVKVEDCNLVQANLYR